MMVAQQDREELKIALISAQESAAIQILLESCLPTTFEREVDMLPPYLYTRTYRHAHLLIFVH